ncbi:MULTISPECIES: hypothetical protein [Sorangium]|uniref:Ferritin n=1 Tax=Sorangium cellulosum TaxID=56 RepID=A0A4P2QGN2_SORCE|nr:MULTISPECIES: hypothetical protein [Sorangium]AUX29009.1 uncharacterized protein SOCE836_010940 [Sorangium cellulosum]WCQ88398.1 hypothetical protein NQZ70_01074 [Sorangium sp. Soce836]
MNTQTVRDEYRPRQRRWSAAELLDRLTLREIELSSEQREEFEPSFWNFLCSEDDSRHFYRQAQARRGRYSDALFSFLEVWREDEANHAAGFKKIYQALYGQSSEAIDARLAARRVDFSRIEEFLGDEFTLCLVLAYDELATTHAYHRDFAFYESLGPDELKTWIRLVTSDEALHHANLLRLIGHQHRHRIPEARRALDRILEIDLRGGDYEATFVLDHSGAGFNLSPEELSSLCAQAIVKKLERIHGGVPTAQELM